MEDSAPQEEKFMGHAREDSSATQASEMLAVDTRAQNGHLTPSSERSSIPPTPDLVHQRSSTALSMASSVPTSVGAGRDSLQNQFAAQRTKILEDEDAEHEHEASGSSSMNGDNKKQQMVENESSNRPTTARMVEA